MHFYYGTGNPAKLEFMRAMLVPLPVEIEGIRSALGTLPAIEESGSDPLENAVIKAEAYYGVLGAPVFSCDSGLFIEELDDAEQPGVHVRTVGGKTLTDAEMTARYAAIAQRFGGVCHARYRNAICLIADGRHAYRSMADDLSGEPFLITATAHPKRRPGFPLDCLSVEIASGQYYDDLDRDRSAGTAAGVQRFFRMVLQDLRQG